MRVLVAINLFAIAVSLVDAQTPTPTISEGDDLTRQVIDLAYDGKYSEALSVATRALEIQEKTLGPEHPQIATLLNDLALLYQYMGDYAKAEPLFQRALAINETAPGPEHSDTAVTLNNLALLYQDLGDYTKAEPLFQRVLQIREKTLGPEHPDTAKSLDNLAHVYADMGDGAKAQPLYQRAERIWGKYWKTPQSERPESRARSGPSRERAWKMVKSRPRPERPDRTTIFKDVAEKREATVRYRELKLGPNHPQIANMLNDAALMYQYMGDYTKAEPLYQRALGIRERVLGPEHPETATILNNLAYLKVAVGKSKEALDLVRRAEEVNEKVLANILSFTSERQRLAFQRASAPYDVSATVGDGSELAKTTLRQKGVVLDSLLEDRLVAAASADPKSQEAVSELRALKQQLMKLQLETPEDVSEQALKKRDTEKKGLSERAEELEAGLARQVAGIGRARRALSITVPQVQSSLSKGEILIELLRYDHYLGKDNSETRYGAVVIPPKGEPKWCPFGDATRIEKSIQLYQKSARGQTDEPTLSGVLRELYKQIWLPIEKALPASAKKITISPDGELSFVSFATLIGPKDKFVGEQYSVRYVASGRDLLREFKATNNSQASVYANPDFGSKGSASSEPSDYIVALRSFETRDLQNISLSPLPGTAAEAFALQNRFGDSAKLFLGTDATKAQLRQVASPRILHLATHGFFLPEMEQPESRDKMQGKGDIPKGKLVNPMHRSGLALAGAQTTLQAWGRGEVPPIENNGILTAEEVGGLKLDGTWLVVLSACETGIGEARAGEGVMGLRRGFIQAGTQNLLMTLWPISDETTVQIMLDFYDAALKSGNAPQALADTERDWLVKLRKERGLLDAVRLAGPFIMSSQGKQ